MSFRKAFQNVACRRWTKPCLRQMAVDGGDGAQPGLRRGFRDGRCLREPGGGRGRWPCPRFGQGMTVNEAQPGFRRGFRDGRCLREPGGRGRWLYPRWGPGMGPGPWSGSGRGFDFPYVMKEASKMMEGIQKDFGGRGFPFRWGYGPEYACMRSGVISAESALPEVKFDGKEFRVKVDVQHFSPEEIDVKIADNMVRISGKHETKNDDFGMVSREFTREFSIPELVEQDSMECIISEDGFLTVFGKVQPEEAPKERTLNIEKEKSNEGKKD